jgi:hypothetical protein
LPNSLFNYSGNPNPVRNQFGSANQIYENQSNLFSQYGLDQHGNNELGTMFQRFGTYQYGPAASRMAFNANQEGRYQQELAAILDRLQNRNYAVQGQRAGNRMTANYGRAQALADQSARAMGLGQGAQLGAAQGLSQRAARDAAAAEESWLDPRRKDADMLQAMQVLSQALQSNPYLEQMMAMFAPVEQRYQQNAREQSQEGFGGLTGGILGNLVGSGALNSWLKKGNP